MIKLPTAVFPVSCSLMKMDSLKAVLKNTLINGMLRHESRPQNAQGHFAWSVLVVDNVSMKILQACMQTYELTQENISCIENIEHQGRPFTNTHAIYFLSPVSFRDFRVFEVLMATQRYH